MLTAEHFMLDQLRQCLRWGSQNARVIWARALVHVSHKLAAAMQKQLDGVYRRRGGAL